jgi:hypothetical protein
MTEPDTHNMMCNAYQAIIETNDKGRETADLIGDMDNKLEAVLQAAGKVKKEHAKLSNLVEGDLMMVPGVDVEGKLDSEDVLVDT